MCLFVAPGLCASFRCLCVSSLVFADHLRNLKPVIVRFFLKAHFSPLPEMKKPVEEIIEKAQVQIREEIPEGTVAYKRKRAFGC